MHITDITQKKHAEERITMPENCLNDLHELHRLSAAKDNEIIDFTIEASLRLMQSEFSFVGIMSADETVMTIRSWSNGALKQCAIMDKTIKFPIAKSGLWGEAVRQRCPIIINDYNTSCELKKGYPQGHVSIKRFLGIPVFDGNRIVAVAGVANKMSDYTDSDISSFTSLLNEMWCILDRKRMEEIVPAKYRDAYKKSMKRLRKRVDELRLENERLEIASRTKSEFLKLHGIYISDMLKLHRLSDATEKDILDFTIKASLRSLQSEFSFVGIMSADETVMTIHSWSNEALKKCAITDKPIEFPMAKSGLLGEVVRQRCPVIINDYTSCELKKGYPEGHVPLKSFLGIPVFNGNRIVVVAGVANKMSDYTDSDVSSFRSLLNEMLGILERKRMEEVLRANEQEFRAIATSAPDAIIHMDEKGCVGYCNPAAERMFSITREEALGKELHKLIVPAKYRDAYKKGMKRLIEKDGDLNVAKTFELTALLKNGTEIPVEISFSIQRIQGKWNAVGIIRDITLRKRSDELRLENQRLEIASRTKSEFLAAMSHELRTPLNAIIGFSDIMTQGIGGSLNQKQKDYVKDIHNAGHQLLLIINDILDLSKVEAGKMELVKEKFSVHELLEETITLIKINAIEHHIKISMDIDSQLGFMDGDKQKIKQVLFNLLSNAMKFSKENGGTITVEVKKMDGMVNFSVSDTGIGIEKKNLNKLFTEFQQVDSGISRKYHGTGLGLAISKKLIELHRGKILVESIYGEGSTFTFSIPLQQGVN